MNRTKQLEAAREQREIAAKLASETLLPGLLRNIFRDLVGSGKRADNGDNTVQIVLDVAVSMASELAAHSLHLEDRIDVLEKELHNMRKSNETKPRRYKKAFSRRHSRSHISS